MTKADAQTRMSDYTVPGLKMGEGHKVGTALQMRLHSLNDLQLTLKHAGTAQSLVDTRGLWFSGRVCGCIDCLKCDRGELAQAPLAALAVVLGFDPGHDREPQFFASVPSMGVQDVLL